ncbi:MAG: ferrous iron transport protein A [Anaerolineaceae bacterium]|nr:ferrous iron transport protein A [Anaerolineaceae bacterium]
MMPLSMVRQGTEVCLIEIRGGMRMRKRLADLGLTCGMKLKTVCNNGNGPIILKVKDSRLAIGRGMLHHILVEPLREPCGTNTTPIESVIV